MTRARYYSTLLGVVGSSTTDDDDDDDDVVDLGGGGGGAESYTYFKIYSRNISVEIFNFQNTNISQHEVECYD
jgi:hypothetical protein